MPYFVILALSGEAEDLEGPTLFGDSKTPKNLIKSLKGVPVRETDHYQGRENPIAYQDSFISELSPRQMLDAMEKKGFNLISCTSNEDYTIWTMHKPLNRHAAKEPTKKVTTKSKVEGVAKGMKNLGVKDGQARRASKVYDDQCETSGSESGSSSHSESESESEAADDEPNDEVQPKPKSAAQRKKITVGNKKGC